MVVLILIKNVNWLEELGLKIVQCIRLTETVFALMESHTLIKLGVNNYIGNLLNSTDYNS